MKSKLDIMPHFKGRETGRNKKDKDSKKCKEKKMPENKDCWNKNKNLRESKLKGLNNKYNNKML